MIHQVREWSNMVGVTIIDGGNGDDGDDG